MDDAFAGAAHEFGHDLLERGQGGLQAGVGLVHHGLADKALLAQLALALGIEFGVLQLGLGLGHRSIAYRIRLQAPDKTLTDEAVAAVRTKCIQAVEKLGGTLR